MHPRILGCTASWDTERVPWDKCVLLLGMCLDVSGRQRTTDTRVSFGNVGSLEFEEGSLNSGAVGSKFGMTPPEFAPPRIQLGRPEFAAGPEFGGRGGF